MARKNLDVPGNAMASAAAAGEIMLRAGQAMFRMDALLERYDDEDVFIGGLSLRAPGMDQSDWFVVVRAETPEGKVVAFHSAPTFLEAIQGVVARLDNRSLKWKEDQYAK